MEKPMRALQMIHWIITKQYVNSDRLKEEWLDIIEKIRRLEQEELKICKELIIEYIEG